MLPSKDWGVELPLMLERQEAESLYLDYKARDALLPPGRGGGGIDKQKRAEDISKDVSSFINSDSGALVYGIRETVDPQSTGGAPIPISQFDMSQDGYLRSEISKESLENLITSNINPRPGPELFCITEAEIEGRSLFVVEMAKGSDAVYQAKDLRYYKRFHFKAEPMEHWEIMDVLNRTANPMVMAEIGTMKRTPEHGYDSQERIIIELSIRLHNIGNRVADRVSIQFWIPDAYNPRPLEGPLDQGWCAKEGLRQRRFLYYHRQPEGLFPLFPNTEQEVLSSNPLMLYLFKAKEVDAREDRISWEVHADHAPPSRGALSLNELFGAEHQV